VDTLEGGNRSYMAGDTSEKGRPTIEISHYNTEYYNPPEEKDFLVGFRKKHLEKQRKNCLRDRLKLQPQAAN